MFVLLLLLLEITFLFDFAIGIIFNESQVVIERKEKFIEVLEDEMNHRGYTNQTLRNRLIENMTYCYKYERLNTHRKICRKLNKFEKAITDKEKLIERVWFTGSYFYQKF